jgi:hypothetical protein
VPGKFVTVTAGTTNGGTAWVCTSAAGGTLNTTAITWVQRAAAAVATTGNITLSGEQTIDGILTSTSRVLVKNQTAPAENGLYVSAAGAWARAADMAVWASVPGAQVTVTGGTVNAGTTWIVYSIAADDSVVGTTPILWSKKWIYDFGFYLDRNLTYWGLAARPAIHYMIVNLGTNDTGNNGATVGVKQAIRSFDMFLRSFRTYETAYNAAHPGDEIEARAIFATNGIPHGEVGILTDRVKWNTQQANMIKATLAWYNLKADDQLHLAPLHLIYSPNGGWDYQTVTTDVTTLTDITSGAGDVAATTGQIEARLSASGFIHPRNPNTRRATRYLRNIVLNHPPPDP